jgi:hypothetical protein
MDKANNAAVRGANEKCVFFSQSLCEGMHKLARLAMHFNSVPRRRPDWPAGLRSDPDDTIKARVAGNGGGQRHHIGKKVSLRRALPGDEIRGAFNSV